ncbi:MAG: endolytic transglycosylase MltG [Bacteroidetes bacterium]|nr:endolytic transglycosylase MltG [Bacteroidota bacterium]
MKIRNILLLLIILLLPVIGAAVYLTFSPMQHSLQKPVEIPRGTSLRDIGEILSDHGIIRSSILFVATAKISGKDDRLQSGLYRFPEILSIPDVVTILADGSHQAYIEVTVREGLTIRQIAAEIEKQCGIPADSILILSRDPSFIATLGLNVRSLEGYLLPETYRVRYDVTARTMLRRLAESMQAVFTEERKRRMREMGRSMHEILTMASLVEGETRLDHERARVAGVYENRLHRGMLLQADPTIQYIIPDGPRRLLYRDLSINSPYNTYMYAGLPPGPVNNPGKASILAALSPESHNYYYFVADGSGGHRFSRTADEHAEAVAAYRRIQRNTVQ